MALGLSLSLSIPRGRGSTGVSLSPSSVLEKTGALGLVGTLSGVTGTPILSDSAGGKFVLMGNQVRCGGVATDYSGATSHSITVIDDAGTRSFTISVTQAGATATRAGGSIFFQRRNGTAGTRVYTGPALTSFFGNGTTAASGTFGVRVRVPRGVLNTDSQSTDFGAFPYILGTVAVDNPRGFQVRYFGPEVASNARFNNRFVIYGKDNGGNGLGNYAGNDTEGAPSGFAGSRGLRSAVITDDEPRLLVLTYDQPTTTFSVFTVKMDGTVEAGDVAVNSAWVGIGTSANSLVIGATRSDGASGSDSNYFSGHLSDLFIGTSVASTANMQEIAKGRDPTTVLGSANIQRHWQLQSTSDLTSLASGQQSQQTFTAANTGSRTCRTGPMLSGAFDGTDGIAIKPLGDGYTEGLSCTAGVMGSTAPLRVKVLVTGAACNVDARVRRLVDGAVILDWHQIGTSVSGASELWTTAVPAQCLGGGYGIDVRRADKTTVIASNDEYHRVGVKMVLEGQSQVHRYAMTGVATLTAPTTSTVSLAYQRGNISRIAPTDIGMLDNNRDSGDGPVAFAERLSTLAPNLAVQMVVMGISSTSIQQWVDNAEIANSVTYPIWGDYTTVGSGFVTDTFLGAGKDISIFGSHRGTSDVDNPNAAAYTDWFQSIYLGTGPRASTKSYAGFTLTNPIHVILWPLARDVDPSNNPYSAGWNAHHLKYNDLRGYQANWTPPTGITASTPAGWFSDVKMDSSTEGPHESASDVRGYITEGYRYALGLLNLCKITTFTHPTVSGVARTSGTVLTVSFNLPNGGSLKPRVAGVAPNGIFEVSEDSGTTWRGQEPTPPFTAAYSGNTVTLTKGGGWAAAGSLRVRFAYGGPYSYGVTTSRATQYANENTDLDGYPYESYANAAPSDGSGYIQGLPIQPSLTTLTVT